MSKIETYQNLIEEFQKIPHTEIKDETFISICGFPHYERVSSNILAFFLDTTREHNLKDLFVKSLLEAAGFNPNDYPTDYYAETEVITDKGNFIDILLKSDEVNIVIENKIYAELYNDLNDYYKTAKEKNKAEPIGIVLSLNAQKVSNKKFRLVLYSDLFKCIKSNFELFGQEANQKYKPFLDDYIENIESLNSQNKMNDKMVELVKKQENDIVSFEKEITNIRKNMRNKVKALNRILETQIADTKSTIWAWRDIPHILDDSVVDFSPNGDKKLDIALSGWSISIWIRKNTTGKDINLAKYLADLGLKNDTFEESKRIRYKLLNKTFNYDDKLEDIAAYIVDIVNKVSNLIKKDLI